MSTKSILGLVLCFILVLVHHGVVASIDYGAALTKSILYYESQRSGKLPADQKVSWRGDSGLKDGSDASIDLVGGYYDAGDNVKFGLPMAYTMTMLSWGALDFNFTNPERTDILTAIKWGTDYLLKAHPQPNVLYGQVGDGISDHECWQRPEEMTTPRTSYKIDEGNPGSDLAGETSAALAAASLVLTSDKEYQAKLLNHSKQLFDFARNHQGLYTNSIPSATQFYPSSDFEDELLWAAVWLYRATSEQTYLDVLSQTDETGGVREFFSWDDKYVGVQVIIARLVLQGVLEEDGIWAEYESQALEFICNCLQKGGDNLTRSKGGLLWRQKWNNLQYTTAAVFVATVYSDSLVRWDSNMQCQDGSVVVTPSELIAFAQSQVDYILGSNPKSMSYMVGFGPNYPTQVHHRGASIVSIKNDPTFVTCKGGFDAWYNRNASDPNVLHGAIVGGPDDNDLYTDSRANYQQTEPAIANAAPLVGVLARLKI